MKPFHKYPLWAQALGMLLIGTVGFYFFTELMATKSQYWDDVNCGMDSLLNLECVRQFRQ